jgi:hypothetical protein
MLSGSLIGSAVGLVAGAGAGLYQAHAAAEARAQQQIQSLSLKPTTIPPNGTESGYVFFPLGEYQKIQAVLGDPEAGSAITVSGNITRWKLTDGTASLANREFGGISPTTQHRVVFSAAAHTRMKRHTRAIPPLRT